MSLPKSKGMKKEGKRPTPGSGKDADKEEDKKEDHDDDDDDEEDDAPMVVARFLGNMLGPAAGLGASSISPFRPIRRAGGKGSMSPFKGMRVPN